MKCSIPLVWTSGHLGVYFLQFLLANLDPSSNEGYVSYTIIPSANSLHKLSICNRNWHIYIAKLDSCVSVYLYTCIHSCVVGIHDNFIHIPYNIYHSGGITAIISSRPCLLTRALPKSD